MCSILWNSLNGNDQSFDEHHKASKGDSSKEKVVVRKAEKCLHVMTMQGLIQDYNN